MSLTPHAVVRGPWTHLVPPRSVWSALLLVAATTLAYVPAMRGGYVWDDDAFVTENPVLKQGWEGLWRIWFVFRGTEQYYPLAYSSFWLEFQAWGLNPTGSHVVNVVLHAANALLLWRVLSVLRVPGAVLAAFVFALHPVEVESVGWITERKNVLSAFFYLLAALAYFRFEPPQEPDATGPRPGRAWLSYALALGFFLCALWSKTVTCSLPAALLIVLWWQRGRIGWRTVLPLLPLFVVGAGLGLLTAWMEKHVIGAKGNDWTIPSHDRLLVAGRALWFYVGKLAWPADLAFFYPRWDLDARVWWQWLYPAAAAATAATLWLTRGRLGKGPLAAALFFVATLFPALGFFDVYPFRYSFVADHFQYLASIGPVALAAAGAAGVARRFEGRRRVVPAALAGVYLCVLGSLTWRQGGMYADLRTFYLTAIVRNPTSWLAHDNLSQVYMADGEVDEAMNHVRQALALRPDDPEAHVNYGNALLAKGRLVEAGAQYENALDARPDFAEAHSDLGNLLLYWGRREEAMSHYRSALAIKPNYPDAHNNLGYALLQDGHTEEAIAQFEQALALRPDYAQARENLAAARSRKAAPAP